MDEASNAQLAAPHGSFTSISAGWTSTCALNEDGHAQCWEYVYRAPPIPPYDRLSFVEAFPGVTFGQPTEIFPWPPGGLAVADKEGSISAYTTGLEPRPILDLIDKTESEGFEHGMLSAAVDPEFSEFPFLYVYYTVRVESEQDEAWARLSRFPVVDGRAVREEELIILDISRPKEVLYHWGGAIRFGPDGMLYLGIGDSLCFQCPQNLENLHGKIIRIDVRGASAEQPYRVPDDNPLLEIPDARPEIWAYGLRNPWRMAFDPHDGSLWVGDVGERGEEEVTIGAAGANLGWPIFEGFGCLAIDDVISPYRLVTEYRCGELEDATTPLISYGREEGCAIVGGVVYRGARIPFLDGVYLFGDFCSGRVWALDNDADAGWRMIEIADLSWPMSSFGIDAAGEVHVLTFRGPILRLVEAESGYVPSKTITPASAARTRAET